ncbi:MAG: hypothetical protein AB1898_27980 [Acidobacteriota bacterium]
MSWPRRSFVKLIPGAALWPVLFPRCSDPTPSSAQGVSLSSKGHRIGVATPDMEVDLVGLGLSRIYNRRTRQTYLKASPALHLIVTDNSEGESRTGLVSEHHLESVRQLSPQEIEVRYQALSDGLPGAQVSGKIRVEPDESLSLEASVRLNRPGLAAVIHPLWGLANRNEVLLPMFGGLRFSGKDYAQLFFDPSTKEGITAKPGRLRKALFPWPNSLSGSFAIYKAGEEGFWVRADDPDWKFKIISFEQTDEHFNLSLWTSVAGSPKECRQFTASRWQLQVFQGPWQQVLDRYRHDLIATSPAWKYRKNQIPWTQDIRLVLNQFSVVQQDPDGTVRDSAELTEKNLSLLKQLSRLVPPEKVLIYPFHWQLIPLEYGASPRYPEWTPSPGFVQFSRAARKMGYRMMPHLNFFAMGPKHPDYAKFEPFVLRDPVNGKKLGWLFNEDKSEGMAYVHPAAPGWFELQLRLVKEMLGKLEADAIFWDQTLNMLNAANFEVNGKTMIEGTLDFLRRMREEFPQLAFGGEGVTELTTPYQDFVQVHTPGVYALTPWDPDKAADFHWGLNPETFPMWAPMVHRLYSDRVRLLGYAAEPDTRSPSFGDWIRLMKEYGLVTSITGLSADDLEKPEGPVRQLLNAL